MGLSLPKETIIFSGIFLGIWLSGCDKFEGEQEVPSYLNISSVSFETEPSSQGTSSQEIVDAWVYVDDQLIGAYELPVTFPVLAEGLHQLEILPGIKMNGIADTRIPYPCARPILLENVLLTPGSELVIGNLSTGYYSNVEFHWIEDFEDPSLSLVRNQASDTSIYRTSPASHPEAFLEDDSKYSGITWLEGEDHYLLMLSDDGNGQGFVLDRGDFVFLEINCKSELPILVGVLISYTDGEYEDRPYIYLNTSEDWNKIYVNLTPVVNESIGADDFKIYFEVSQESGAGKKTIMLDNIKLLSRPNL